MATVDDLNDVAQAFLDAATDALNLTPAGAPGRIFLSPGEPALDCCGQLTVWVQSLEDAALQAGNGALARGKAVNRGTQPQMMILIQATRCVDLKPDTVTQLPLPANLQAAEETINRDGWALRCHLLDELRHGSLKEVCAGAEFIGATKLTPQGGCVGWIFTFRYQIEGGIIGP